MNRIFRIEVDCANCANLIEAAAARVDGVKELSISFLTGKMKVVFEEGADVDAVVSDILKVARKVQPEFELL
ncbi:MAG: heavy-metal-associated domain-containing protein, partial [Paramuribaculum sp.]|nr:heavy-metal-associated domain-containing protein [Paramuribaculum sp.]